MRLIVPAQQALQATPQVLRQVYPSGQVMTPMPITPSIAGATPVMVQVPSQVTMQLPQIPQALNYGPQMMSVQQQLQV